MVQASFFWYGSWADGCILKDVFPSLFFICEQKNQCVNRFRFPSNLDAHQLGWNFHLPLSLSNFNPSKAQELHLFLSRFWLDESGVDQLIWTASPGATFSVADAINILVQSSGLPPPVWPKIIWGNNVPFKIMVFHWLAIKQCIPVRDILASRSILPPNVSTLCVFCMTDIETIDHLLIHCKWSSSILSDLFRWWNIRWIIPRSIVDFSFDWFYGMGIKASKFWKLIGPATMWAIWMARNDFIFNGKFTCRSIIVRNIKLKVFLWASSLKLVHGLQAYVWDQNPFLFCQ
ncbi:uncharacterized protein [Rutidosis leptorrhynchoides]|uniref:uncharacterized protein n=1 Tax=Rutidosis leptorrhynchoides TaxID=125765 RepID=UPI003A99DA73